MEQNKTGKYFKYAIGEIVLVVIGILIALQINTWNESRIRSIETKLRLSNLIADLEDDKKDLIIIENNSVFKFHAMQYLLKMAGVESYNSNMDGMLIPSYEKSSIWEGAIPNKYNKAFIQIAFVWSQRSNVVYSNKTTYDELKSTGEYSYISNDELKKQINTYYRNWEWRFTPKIEDFIERWVYSLDKTGIIESNPFSIEKPLSIIANDPERAAILRRLTREIGWYAWSAKTMLKENIELIEAIKTNIK